MEWIRYWYKCLNFKFDSDGYLLEPYKHPYLCEDSNNTSLYEIINNDEICSILFGESGIGKTTELKRLNKVINKEQYVLYSLNLERNYNLEKLIESIKNNLVDYDNKRKVVIIIDNIEGLDREVYDIFDALKIILEHYVEVNIKLLISCRTGCWINNYDEELSEFIEKEKIKKYYLAPLTKENVESYIYQELDKESAENLINNIDKYKLQPFARIPITLKLLLTIKDIDYDFKLNRGIIYKKGCTLLCKNHIDKIDNVSIGVLDKMKIAKYIAYISILSDKRTIVIENDFSHSKQCLYAIEHLVTNEISEDGIRNVLNTNLFIKIDEKSYRWAHRSYAEYLCADYLKDNFSEHKINNIIFHHVVKERIIPKLKPITAWLLQLEINEKLIAKVLENDYDVTFLSDLSDYTEKIKKDFILKIMHISGSKYWDIKLLDKQIYMTCNFEGLEQWIEQKLKLLYLYFEKAKGREQRDKIIKEIFELDNSDILCISEYIICVLVDIAVQCKFKSVLKLSLKALISYHNINEIVFNSYIQAASDEELDSIFEIIYNNTYKQELNVDVIRSTFILNLLNHFINKKETNQILDILNNYYEKVIKKDGILNVDSIINKIPHNELYDWSQNNVSTKNSKLINKIGNVVHKDKVDEISVEKIEIIDINSGLKNGMNSELQVKKSHNKREFKYIILLCNNVINGKKECWNTLIKELLMRNNYSILKYKIFSKCINPALEALDAIGWDKIEFRKIIVDAAKEYFCSHVSDDIKKGNHQNKIEHEILLSILLEGDPDFFKSIEVRKLENWIIDIVNFEPFNEYLLKIVYIKLPDKFFRIVTRNLDGLEFGCALVKHDLEPLKYIWNESISKKLYNYLISDKINDYKRKEIFNFLYKMRDKKAIEYAENVFHGAININLELKLFFLNTYFVNGEDGAFDIFIKLSKNYNGFTAKFLNVLRHENQHFNFLKQYSAEQIYDIYINFNKDKEMFIAEESKSDEEKPGNSQWAEMEFKAVKKNLVYWLIKNGDNNSLENLYKLTCLFKDDEIVLKYWNISAEKYLNNSWKGNNINDLKAILTRSNNIYLDQNYSYDKLLKSIMVICARLQGRTAYEKILEEDDRTGVVADFLISQGYINKDQTHWGKSQSGKKSGEVDIFIVKENGMPFSIIEALNLNCLNKTTINSHLDKIFEYDSTGLKYNFILVFSIANDFGTFWDKYYDYVSKYNYKYRLIEHGIIEEEEYADLRVAITKHIRNNKETNLYHICVNLKR